MYHLEGQLLAGFAARHGGPVLEIGADLGISTRYIHEGLDWHGDDSKIYSVDIHHKWDSDPNWTRRVRIDADSQSYHTPEPCQWGFIDGDHRYAGVRADIQQAAYVMKISQLIFHDTSPRFTWIPGNTSDGSQARAAVCESLGSDTAWELWDVPTPCGLILAIRK